MDLYMSPLTCSLAAHVACLEAGLPITLRCVDRLSKRLDDGSDYRDVAPLGVVPVLMLGDGTRITEMSAVLQWVADRSPEKQLAPRWGSAERYELMSWIHFVSTELHKKHLWMIYSAETPPAVKEWARIAPKAALDVLERHLEHREHLMDTFTVADAYLFWALFVAPHGGISLEPWPALERYVARLRERPSIKTALAIERPMFKS